MSNARLEHAEIRYRVDGPADGNWLIFSNSLGADLSMWDEQAHALSQHFRILRYDRRGHGASSVPPAPYSMADLGTDVLGLMDHLGIARASFCGLSLGGLVGQWLALHAPQRIERLALCSTAAKIGGDEVWLARIELVRRSGLEALVDGTFQRWFTTDFTASAPTTVDALRSRFLATSTEGYIGCCHAVRGADFRTRLASIRKPLLTIAGAKDPVTTPADLDFIAERVPGARAVVVPGAHLCNVESSAEFSTALTEFMLH